MPISARNTLDGAPLEIDVCIIGSGPAGVTLARELAGSRLRILIVESGGETTRAEAGSLNEGTVDSPQGYPAHVLVEGRRRQQGGTANLWNHEPRGQPNKFIRCVPLDEQDFEQRDWIPDSGWPFSRAELVPYYQRAQKAFGLGAFSYIGTDWQEDAARYPLLEMERLESSVSQFALPRFFLANAFSELSQLESVSIRLDSTLVRLERDPVTEQITFAELADASGKREKIAAKVFVLAAGGLENPRILLLNTEAQSGGIGNQHDMVGRCFMDHPSITLGTLIPNSRKLFDQASFYDQHQANGQAVMGKLQIRPDVMRAEKLLNLYAVLVPRFRNLHGNLPFIFKELLVKGPQFLKRQRTIPSATAGGGRSEEAGMSIRERLLGGYFSECYCGWSRLANKADRFGDFTVRALVETVPNCENRVMLGEIPDRLGQLQMKVIWKWSVQDLTSIRRTQEIFRSELAAKIGEFHPVSEGGPESPRAFYSTHHFLGTTRMHVDPRQGVVDAQSQVHGTSNLFIAGSSVFPTGGCANPTLTVVALAIRLADFLKSRFGVEAAGSNPQI